VLERALGEAQLAADPAGLSATCEDPARAAEALAALADAGIGVSEFALGSPSLDEVFLALTGHPAEETDEEGSA
jgi:ABC-2 type transport system ATP-binding protein